MNRSPRRIHDRQFFYKYMSARIAKIVLATRKLRWSSPLLFNDPFDVTQELRINFTEGELSVAVGQEVAALIVEGGPPPDGAHPILKSLLNTLNAQRTSNDLRRRLAQELQSEGPTPGQIDAWAEMKQTWNVIVPMLRILCLSELNDVTPMWLNYADSYRGVVLQLEAVDELDSALLMAGVVPLVVELG